MRRDVADRVHASVDRDQEAAFDAVLNGAAAKTELVQLRGENVSAVPCRVASAAISLSIISVAPVARGVRLGRNT
jgi:hypothetical protein